MMNKSRLGLKGIGLGLALLLSAVAAPQAGASPLGSAQHLRDAAAVPLVDVQARRPARPVRRPVRRNRNGAAVAGALVGAAIIGGAIIANSEAERRQRRRAQYYYYGEPQYYYGQPRRVYRSQPRYYYDSPRYYQPQPRYRRANPGYRNVPDTYAPNNRFNDARSYPGGPRSGTEP